MHSRQFTLLLRKSKIVHFLLACVISFLFVFLELQIGLDHREYLSRQDFHNHLPYLSHAGNKIGNSPSVKDDTSIHRWLYTRNTSLRPPVSDIRGERKTLKSPSVSQISDHAQLKKNSSSTARQTNDVDKSVSSGTAQSVTGQSAKSVRSSRVMKLVNNGPLETVPPDRVMDPVNNSPLETVPPSRVMDPVNNSPLETVPPGRVMDPVNSSPLEKVPPGRAEDPVNSSPLETVPPGRVMDPVNNSPLETVPPGRTKDPVNNSPLETAPAAPEDTVAVPGAAVREWKPPPDAGTVGVSVRVY